ncbi:MAG: hypothetical protein PHT19_08885 [Methylococcus sp.]|nr:hypothetical protein [Methylococcus sp.]
MTKARKSSRLTGAALQVRRYVESNSRPYYWLVDLHRQTGVPYPDLSAAMLLLSFRRETFASRIDGHQRKRVCFVRPGAKSPRKPVGRPRFNLLDALGLEWRDGAYRPVANAQHNAFTNSPMGGFSDARQPFDDDDDLEPLAFDNLSQIPL